MRAMAWAAGGLAVIILVTSVGGYVLYKYYNGRIGHIQLVIQHPRPADAAAGSENFLLVGVDSRAGTGNEYRNSSTGVQAVDGERSDTTILAHLDKNGTTTLLSFPRDTYVTIPSYKDSTGDHAATKNRINQAISNGGPSLLVATIEGMTDIKIDHYVQVDLAGFKQMTNAVGGVNVCLAKSSYSETNPADNTVSTNLNDGYSRFSGQVGENHLSGDQALAFVRQRHGLPGGDIDRIKRQQVFMGALFRKATSTGVLLNPDHVLSLLSSVSSALTTDKDTSLTDLAKLASRVKGLDPSKITFETVPTRQPTTADGGFLSGGLWQLPNVGAVEMLDTSKFDTQLAALKDQSSTPATADTPSASAKPLTVPASQIGVTVKNGTLRSGLAGSTATALTAQGFQVGSPVDADRHDIATSVVYYAPGQEEQARTLQAAVPGSTLRIDNTVGTSLILVLGDNFTAVSPVHVGSSASSTAPSASASASSGGTANGTTPANAPANAAAAGTPCANPIY
jgi:LCP family protein required for cell wall assembly